MDAWRVKRAKRSTTRQIFRGGTSTRSKEDPKFMAALFTPLTVKSITLRNRIVASPMCQYSAQDGVITDWQRVHLPMLARGGVALVISEATAVSAEGRITPADAGIWTDEQAEAWSQVVPMIKAAGAVPGMQLGHAGRKASANLPWEGDDHMAADDPRAWEILAPSPIAKDEVLNRVPREMSLADIERTQDDYVKAAVRARDAGIEWLELHFAHGYLAQSFFSTHSNRRTDRYGGSFENRARFLLETLAKVRAVWPERLPLSARFGVTEFDGTDDLEEGIEMVRLMKAAGLDFIDVSGAFSLREAKVPFGPGFMVPAAERIRREVDIPTGASWFINDPHQAEEIIAQDRMDLVYIGRALLANPHWPYQAAVELDADKPSWVLPAPYAHWLSRYRPNTPDSRL